MRYSRCPSGYKEHIDAQLSTWGIRQIQNLSINQPFFLATGFFRPHFPFYAPSWCFDQYSLPVISEYMSSVLNREAGLKLIDRNVDRFYNSRHKYLIDLINSNSLSEYIHGYLASVTFADYNIGNLLNALRQSPHWNNTVVVIWSDHGYHLGERLIESKRTIWERATTVPLMIRVPGLNEGSRCNATVSTIDIYKTLADLCFGEQLNNVDGNSLVTYLRDPAQTSSNVQISAISLDGDEILISSIKNIGYSARYERWIYGVYNLQNRYISEEFYNLNDDPHQLNNLLNGQLSSEQRSILTMLQNAIPRNTLNNFPLIPQYPSC